MCQVSKFVFTGDWVGPFPVIRDPINHNIVGIVNENEKNRTRAFRRGAVLGSIGATGILALSAVALKFLQRHSRRRSLGQGSRARRASADRGYTAVLERAMAVAMQPPAECLKEALTCPTVGRFRMFCFLGTVTLCECRLSFWSA